MKEFIEKWDVRYNDGKLFVKDGVSSEALAYLREHKQEFLAYFKEQSQTAAAESAKKIETFMSIPGVRELMEAREEYYNYSMQLEKDMDSGVSVFHGYNGPDPAAISMQYPGAVFALEVSRKSTSENYEISTIAGRAKDALESGEPWETVKTKYDTEMAEFTKRHLWD